jgi:hypothetical protein
MQWDAVLHPREGRRNFTIDESLLLANGVCDETNAEYTAHAVLAYLSLLDDSPLALRTERKPWSSYVMLIKEITHTPIKGFVQKYAALADRILTGPTLTGGGDERGEFVSEMMHTPIFVEYLTWWRGGSHDLLHYIISFLKFLKKMKYVDESFNANAFRKWLGVEEKLARLTFEESDYMRSLRTVVHYLCGSLTVDVSHGRFGPGSVSERGILGPWSKALSLRFDRRLQRLFSSDRLTSGLSVQGDSRAAFKYMNEALKLTLEESSSSAHSRLMFVPKDTSTARSICMEPNSYMFAQQLVLRGVETALRRNPIGRFVDLRNQNRNQYGAWYGSVTGALDTIDLSSASDTVHVDLIRRLFPRDWLYYLLGTRVARVELPDGKITTVKKFAPMGSALCFPTQCIIFTAVVVTSMLEWLAGREHVTLPLDPGYDASRTISRLLRNGVHRGYKVCKAFTPNRLEEPTVYGDDILCDSRVTDDVMRRLDQLGFVVNASKSFTGSQSVRESCGRYYVDGSDITPFLYKPLHSVRGITPTRYVSLIGHVNLAWEHGFWNTRSTILRTLKVSAYPSLNRGKKKQLLPSVVPLIPYTTDPNGFGVYVLRRTSLGITRLNRDLQLTEERTLRVRTVSRKPSSESLDRYEAYSYYRDTHTRSLRDEASESSHAQLRPDDTRFSVGWTPLRA